MNWLGGVPADRLFLSAVTIGEIQAGIETTRERDVAKAEELASWLDQVVAGYGVLPMDAAAFREWARLKHGKSDALTEDAMIAATAKVHPKPHRLICPESGQALDAAIATVYGRPIHIGTDDSLRMLSTLNSNHEEPIPCSSPTWNR